MFRAMFKKLNWLYTCFADDTSNICLRDIWNVSFCSKIFQLWQHVKWFSLILFNTYTILYNPKIIHMTIVIIHWCYKLCTFYPIYTKPKHGPVPSVYPSWHGHFRNLNTNASFKLSTRSFTLLCCIIIIRLRILIM